MSMSLSESTRFLHAIELGFGTYAWGDRIVWQYGRGYTDKDLGEAFKVAIGMGIHLIDTAEVYGQGRAERLLGKFMQETQQPVLVATKFMPFPWRFGKKSLIKALQQSLERLCLEQVDLYQIHWPFPPVPIETWMEAMNETVKLGLVRAVGVSNFNHSQMLRAQSTLSKSNIPLASNQVEFSLLDRSVEKNGLLDLCKNLGMRLIAYSPLAKGLLTGKYTPENPPPTLRARHYPSPQQIQPLLKLMTEIGRDQGSKTPGQIALNWVICKGALPIPGVKTPLHAEQNAGALGWRLTDDQIKALDKASDELS